MNQPENNISNAGAEQPAAPRRSRRSSRSLKSKKKYSFKRLRKWMKKHPSKAIAIFSVGLIIILSISFYIYDMDMLTAGEVRPENKNPIKGVLLPVELVSESSPLTIKFGATSRTVSLKELRKGYVISPQKMINCAPGNPVEDRTRFILSLIEDRLYVNANFNDITGNEKIAGADGKHWTIRPKKASAFYSDDNSFKVYDTQGNINFNMQFEQPDVLIIEGYFSGAECIYVAGSGANFSDAKTGNYIERLMPEIKRLKMNTTLQE